VTVKRFEGSILRIAEKCRKDRYGEIVKMAG
jgi:hypothetical protein